MSRITKVWGIGKTPPSPYVGKNSQKILYFFWGRPLFFFPKYIPSSVCGTDMVSWWERTCCARGRRAKTRAQVISFRINVSVIVDITSWSNWVLNRWQWRSACLSPWWGRHSNAGWGHFLGPGMWQVQRMPDLFSLNIFAFDKPFW